MGCDIHPYLEYTDYPGSRWFWHVDLPRNYLMFGLMAGVRWHEVSPRVEPRGIPENLSAPVLREYTEEGLDAHTPSWLSADELEQVCLDYVEASGGQGPPVELTATIAAMRVLPEARLVFWFDN